MKHTIICMGTYVMLDRKHVICGSNAKLRWQALSSSGAEVGHKQQNSHTLIRTATILYLNNRKTNARIVVECRVCLPKQRRGPRLLRWFAQYHTILKLGDMNET
jgi:hypothetical protein